ncbi:hypothetical protein NQ317_006379 [Molorchus minor]|uniref:Uncharacterized protein n=1 Tax=Molorchus minor TaxID=1323400 RepID=A0ABQ9JPQ4_9CUCU|nr:hypothetical protein NQ317_006379 [Molorchus minor]
MAVLAVRDRQIKEIRSEMTQLQEVVNEQLMEFHNNALGSIPSNNNIGVNPTSAWNAEQNKENVGDIGDTTLSTINSNNDPHQEFIVNRATVFKDLPCGDVSENVLLNDGYPIKDERCLHATERHESQATIRQMFNELKQTAYELSNAAHNQNWIIHNRNYITCTK